MTSYSSEPMMNLRHNNLKSVPLSKRNISISEDDQHQDSKSQDGDKKGNQASGRWKKDEHHKFIEGIKMYGRNWKLIEEHIGSRTGAQIRSHAQKFFNRIEKLKEQNQTITEQQKLLLDIMNMQPKQSQIKSSPPQKQHSHHIISSLQSEQEQQIPIKQHNNQSITYQLQQQQQQQQSQLLEKKSLLNRKISQIMLKQTHEQEQISSLSESLILQQQQQQTQNQFSHFHQFSPKQMPCPNYPPPYYQKQIIRQGIQDNIPQKYPSAEIVPNSQLQGQQQLQNQFYGAPNSSRKSSASFYLSDVKQEQARFGVQQQGSLPLSPYSAEGSFQMKLQGSTLYSGVGGGGVQNDKLAHLYDTPQNYQIKEDSNEIGIDYHSIFHNSNHQNNNFSSVFKSLEKSAQSETNVNNNNNNILNNNSILSLKQAILSPPCYSNSSPPLNSSLYHQLQLQPLEDKEEDEVDKYLRPVQDNSLQENSYFTEHHLADITEPRLYEMCVLGQQELQSSSSLNFRSEVYLPAQRGQVKGRSRFGSFKLHDEENEIQNLKYYKLRKASVDDQELKKKLKMNDGQQTFNSNQQQQIYALEKSTLNESLQQQQEQQLQQEQQKQQSTEELLQQQSSSPS